MNVLYQIPGLFLVALCHVVVIYYMAEHRYAKKRWIFYSCIFVLFFVGLGGYGYKESGFISVLSYIGIVICTFLFSCIVSRDCFSKKCFLFITYFCLFSSIDNILKITVKLLLPDMPDMPGYYVVVLLRSLILLLLLALYKRYAAATFRALSDISGRRWWNLALTACLFYLAQAMLSVANVMTDVSPIILLLLFVVITLVMCVVYGVVFSNISYMKKDAQAALVRQNAEYLAARLSALQNAEEKHRRLRHDMRHHFETIAEYAKEGNTAPILAYIREYIIEVSETTLKQYSENRTINSILSVYAGKAKESGIVFSVRCNAPRDLAVREIDQIALLGNLFENALHGCRESQKEQLRIDIYIRLQNNRFIVVCNNTCPDDLKMFGNLPSESGIGISSILNVCQKYEGSLDYTIENGICSVCAVLNL